MKHFLFLSVLLHYALCGIGLHAQDSLRSSAIELNSNEKPMFPGGESELRKYLALNLRYPNNALEGKIEGSVDVSFKISEHGKISAVKIVKGLGYGCDEEAIRVIKHMPDWTPAHKNGRAISVLYSLSILFELPQDDNVGGN